MNLRVFYYTNRHGYNHIKDIAVTKMQMLTKIGNMLWWYMSTWQNWNYLGWSHSERLAVLGWPVGICGVLPWLP